MLFVSWNRGGSWCIWRWPVQAQGKHTGFMKKGISWLVDSNPETSFLCGNSKPCTTVPLFDDFEILTLWQQLHVTVQGDRVQCTFYCKHYHSQWCKAALPKNTSQQKYLFYINNLIYWATVNVPFEKLANYISCNDFFLLIFKGDSFEDQQ